MGPKVSNDKQKTILQAASRVFASKGYHSSTVSDVAAEASVAAGTIYLYFEHKEELLAGLFTRFLGDYLAVSRDELFSQEPGGPQLHKLIGLHLNFFAKDRDLAKVFQIHMREVSPPLRSAIGPVVHEYFSIVDLVIQNGIEAGAFEMSDPRLARQVIFGSLDAAVTGWVLSGRDNSICEQVDPLHELLLKSLKA